MKRHRSFRDIFNSFFKPNTNGFTIRAVVVHSHDDALWTVQGLEYDITAQGNTPEQAVETFGNLLCSWIVLDLEKQRKPFSALPKAPQKYWDMFEQTHLILQAQEQNNVAKFPNRNFIPRQELRLCNAWQ